MNISKEDMKERPFIIIEEKPDVVPGQSDGDTPVITIECDDSGGTNVALPVKAHRRLPWVVGSVIITVIACVCAVFAIRYYYRYINIGVSVSVTSEQNIQNLKKKAVKVKPEVVLTSDSVLGVGLNMYEIRGLRAEISFEEPDTTDSDVYLYSRCCDFTSYDPALNHYLGSLVVKGEEKETDTHRLGYCAMANDNVVIGVARDEDVKDYCIEQAGSFFRQFVLVSNGMLPPKFYLHGKVERRGLGRIGDKLFYIETKNKETMWDFADAIREYGFTDAIYITGGADRCFYRSADGEHHYIGDVANVNEKNDGDGIIPWIVFRKK